MRKIAQIVKDYTQSTFFHVPCGKFYTWLKTFTQPSVVMVVTNVRCANRRCDIFTDEWEETWRGALWQKTSDELCGERRTCSCTETNPINFWFLSLGQLLPSFYVSLALVRVKGRKYVFSLEASWPAIPDQWVGLLASWHASWQPKSWSVVQH